MGQGRFPTEELVDILAFLGAGRDYSAIDRLANAIDEVAIYEAVRDAIRAYQTWCGAEKCVEAGEGRRIMCPEVDPENLKKAADMVAAKVNSGDRLDAIKFAREMAMKAYARIPTMAERACT